MLLFSGFSRQYGYPRCRLARRPRVLSGSAPGVDLPAPVGAYALQRPVPSGRGGVTPASPRHVHLPVT